MHQPEQQMALQIVITSYSIHYTKLYDWEIWRFIKPALHENEVKKSRGAAFFTSILFSIGILFAYFIIVPLSVHFLSNYQVSPKVENIISLNSYINTITSIVLAGVV